MLKGIAKQNGQARRCSALKAPECRRRNGIWKVIDFDRRGSVLHAYCKTCRRQSAREYKKRNRKAISASLRDWKRRHPGQAEKLRRNWYLKNAVQERAKTAKWKRENPILHRAYNRLRTLARKGHWLTDAEWDEVLTAYGRVCLKCGSPHVTVDHVVPLTHGGTDTKDNVQPLCRPCNSSKKCHHTDYRPDKGNRFKLNARKFSST